MADSPEYHAAHLAFARSTIVTAAAKGEPILDLLKTYTEDVGKAEADCLEGAVSAERARIIGRLVEMAGALDQDAVAGTAETLRRAAALLAHLGGP